MRNLIVTVGADMKLGYVIRKQLFIAVGLLLICATAWGQDANPIDVTVCDLVAHAKEFNKKQVRVRARLVSGMHGSALFDVSKQCDGKGVHLWFPKDAQDHPDFRALDDILIHHGNIGTSDKTIIGTFTGQFLRDQKLTGTNRKASVLDADKVDNLNVKYNTPPQ